MPDLQGTDEPDQEIVNRIIESERTALQEAVSEIFVNLCGSCNPARQCLFASGNLKLLCEFLGQSKGNSWNLSSRVNIPLAEYVLMHMITLLNDKSDWELRATFFESCPVVAQHLTTVRNSKILPFLQQGLQDPEEFVTYQAFACLYRLCDQNLLEKAAIFSLMPDVIPFLAHPVNTLLLKNLIVLEQMVPHSSR
jgi:hypothetical protein